MRHGLLLCALALAVLGMHHLALGPQQAGCHQPEPVATSPGGGANLGANLGAPAARPSGAPATDNGHDLLHLCVAILNAAAWLLLLAVAWTAAAGAGPPAARSRSFVRRTWRRRRPAGRSLLLSICVLRT
jgi:hypothetical protein